MSDTRVLMTTLSNITLAPAGTLIVLALPRSYWQSGRVCDDILAIDWSKVKGEVTVCFGDIDNDPREVWEFAEIRAYVRDVMERVPALVKRMADERDFPTGLFGKWSFLAVGGVEEPMDLVRFSDKPPVPFGRVFIQDGYAKIDAVTRQ